MNLWDIAKKVGLGMLTTAVPGAGAMIGLVNTMLPADKKLPETATGQQLESALNSMPAEQRSELMLKEFDVEITEIKESHSTIRTMLESDAQNPHTTRPYIAKHAFHVIAFTIIITVLAWAYGVITKDAVLVKAVMDGWPFILAVNAPLVVLLRAYFGVLKREHKNRLDAANGNSSPSGIAAIVAAIGGKHGAN